jgi:hypothetical protein
VLSKRTAIFRAVAVTAFAFPTQATSISRPRSSRATKRVVGPHARRTQGEDCRHSTPHSVGRGTAGGIRAGLGYARRRAAPSLALVESS